MSVSMSMTKQIWDSQSMEIPCGSDGEESAHDAGDLGSVPGLGRSSGVGNGFHCRVCGFHPWLGMGTKVPSAAKRERKGGMRKLLEVFIILTVMRVISWHMHM